MNLIQTYYQAWETNDSTLLDTILHPQLFGVRTYNESVFYNRQDVIQACNVNTILHAKPFKISNQDQVVRYQLDVSDEEGNHVVIAKAIIKDDKIFKIYEEIIQQTTRYKCVCMYDGTDFSGYQKQLQETTIQQTIEEAIQQALNLDVSPTIHASGRTDKGVHALHQVFHVDLSTTIPLEKFPLLINRYLPDSIYITQCDIVDQTFHSRYDVISKEYQYVINTHSYNPIQRNYEWFVPNLNVTLFQEALLQVIGTHDFQSFTKTSEQSTIRTIQTVHVAIDETHINITIKGTGFMRYMVRYIIGAAVAIAQGKLSYTMEQLLLEKDSTLLKELAPASGLYLYGVEYE